MEKTYWSFTMLILIIVILVDIRKHAAFGAVLRTNKFDKDPTINRKGALLVSDEIQRGNPGSDTIYVAVGSSNNSTNFGSNLTPSLTGSVAPGSFNTGVDHILGAASSYKPQVSSSSSYSPSSGPLQDIQQSQLTNSPSIPVQDDIKDELLSLTGGWSAPDSEITAPTLVLEAALNIGIAAAVYSNHSESVYVEGDQWNPAVANVLFGSDAHYGVFGNTLQETEDGTASQHSVGNLDGGTSQMYEIMTLGETNEVTVEGSSDAVGSGSMTQQSLSDIYMSSDTLLNEPQNTEATENLNNEDEQKFQETFQVTAEATENLNGQAEDEQKFQESFLVPVEANLDGKQTNLVDGIAEQLLLNSDAAVPTDTDTSNDQEDVLPSVLLQ